MNILMQFWIQLCYILLLIKVFFQHFFSVGGSRKFLLKMDI
jgi:hypothetical protein